jgi:CDP-paratose 2-epimerase
MMQKAYYHKMKIFITGICGFVGSTLAKCLVDADSSYEIFGMDNLGRPGSWLNKPLLEERGIKIYHGDIRQASDLEIIPKADWVIDAAANPSVLAGVDGKSSSLQLVQNNLNGTVNLLEYCKRHRAGFILLSTSRVYSIPALSSLKMQIKDKAFIPDATQKFPLGISPAGVAETYSTAPPISLYGCTKLSSEQLALEYGITYQFPVWINRCGVMAGPGQFGHPGQGIFAYWIHSFKEDKALKYVGFGGSGFQVRDCLHPGDLISLLQKQFSEPLSTDKPRVANISGGVENSMSLAQLTRWCNENIREMDIEETNTERPFDIPWMILDYELASSTWGWQPQTSITEVLQQIVTFANTQSNWCAISAS